MGLKQNYTKVEEPNVQKCQNCPLLLEFHYMTRWRRIRTAITAGFMSQKKKIEAENSIPELRICNGLNATKKWRLQYCPCSSTHTQLVVILLLERIDLQLESIKLVKKTKKDILNEGVVTHDYTTIKNAAWHISQDRLNNIKNN